MSGLLDFLQAASNSAASNVSGPVDALAWLLKKAGIDVGTPVGGSDWMEQKGLTRKVPQSAASLAGETAGLLSPIVAAAKAPQIAKGLLQAGDNLAAPRTLDPQTGAIVWHGSPHKFDKFDSSKIGTGEGAQAYGHGLYLADAPAVAQTYKDLNPTALTAPIRAFKGAELTPGTPEYHAATLLDDMGLQQARKQVAGWIATARPEMAREAAGWQKTLDTLNAATSKADFKRLKNTGNLYKVDLPDSAIAKMLDWDKPLSQQADTVKDAIAKNFPGTYVNGRYVDPFNDQRVGKALLEVLGSIADKRNANGLRSAESALQAAGIPGIRYLDGGSRGAGSGTSNYVVFPGGEDLLTILERNGIPVR